MNDVTNVGPGGVPASFLGKLSAGIAQSRASTVLSGGGKSLLRLLRDGIFVHGQANLEVEPNSRWAVNILSLAHGYSCWIETGAGQKNKLAGEVMVSIGDPKPQQPDPIQGQAWAEQRSFELKCMDGADTHQEVLYKTTSVGGMRAVDGLLAAIQSQLVTDPEHPCPVIIMTSESYPHTKYGKIYNPIFTIVGWSDMNGNVAGPSKPALDGPAEAPAAPEPVRATRSRPAAVADAPAAAPAAAAPAAAAPAGQRRRQSVR